MEADRKSLLKKVCHKGVSCSPSLRSGTLVTGLKSIVNFSFLLYFYYCLLSCSSKDWICCLHILFWLSPIDSQFWHLPLKPKIVKIRKEHKNIFCGPSKIFRNISWPINIWLKYFMTPAKTLRLPFYIPNVRSLNAIKSPYFSLQLAPSVQSVPLLHLFLSRKAI